MPHSYAHSSGILARELYQLLRDLDPKAWKDELDEVVHGRAKDLLVRLAEHSAGAWPDDRMQRLNAALSDLQDRIEAALPADGEGSGAERWQAFRAELQPGYEALRDALRPYAIHVPSLRPTNYARNVLHLVSGLTALTVVQLLSQHTWALIAAGTGFALFAWTLEVSRRLSPQVNRLLMGILGRVAHPHEAHKVNSSTWFATALMVLAWTSSPVVISVAVAVLAAGDPAAAIIGRRYGRLRITNGRSLEGSLAFVGVGSLAAAFTVLALYGLSAQSLTGLALTWLALSGAAAGAVAELLSRTIDDNFSVPLAAAAGAGLVALFLGL